MAEEPGLFGDEEGAPSPGFFDAVAEAGERAGVRGRPKGARNKHSVEFEKLYYAKGYRDPALVLGELVSADPRALQAMALEDELQRWRDAGGEGPKPRGPGVMEMMGVIVDAADRLMPYLHGKKPTEIVVTDERLPMLMIITNSNQLEEAQQLLAERQALSAGVPLTIEQTPANPGLSEGEE
jgi:hypothetical protein